MDDYGDKDAILPANFEVEVENHVSRKLKFFLIAFSMFFWVLGALFVAIGGYVVSQSMGYSDLTDFAVDPGIIVALLGIIVFGMSTFGVLGALRENICLLKSYKYLLLGTLLFEVFCAFIGFAFWPEIKKVVDKSLNVAIEKYTTNPDLRNMIDMLQRQLGCCGSLTIDDWDSNQYFSCKYIESYRSCGVPWSCCHTKYQRNRQCGYGVRKNRVHLNLAKEIHVVGCLDKAFEFFRRNMTLVSGLAIAFAFPLIVGIFMTHFFIKQICRQIAANEKAAGKVGY